MEIFELLDRYELLFPEIENFQNLRRLYVDGDYNSLFKIVDNEELRKAIIEQNIHSIFRLVDNKEIKTDVEEFRKAVLELNLHSIFRILDNNEDLRKAVVEKNEHAIFRCAKAEEIKKVVLDDNIHSLYRLFDTYKKTNITAGLRRCTNEDIWFDSDCLSRGQVKSKIWLINELKKLDMDLGSVFLCAGWYGLLATLILESEIKVLNITNFDSDPNCEKIANTFNKEFILDEWKYKHVVQNINDINYQGHIFDVNKSNGTTERIWETPKTIINTSCEHVDNFVNWYMEIPNGMICVLQSNNYFDVDEHVNCSHSLDEFAFQTPMQRVWYEGELELGHYKRFMRIGIK